MEEIAGEINLNLSAFKNDKNSPTFIYYRSKQWFEKGNFDTEKLLKMGFVLTSHKDYQKAGDAAWGIMNPNLTDEGVSKEKVKQFLKSLSEVAIEVALEYLSF